MKRIVVGVDGSPSSLAAMRFALREAELHGATLVAVHAWQAPIVYGTGFAPTPVPSEPDDIELSAKAVLDEAVATVVGPTPSVVVEKLVVEGAPGEVLLDLAAQADLLVVGCRGHGTVMGMLLGSVSQHCVHRASCPVVVVPNPAS